MVYYLAMRIIVFSIVAVVLFAAAALGLFVLLVGLNGYSEAQATPSLIAYIVLCLATVPALGIVGAAAARVLVEKKRFSNVGASACAITGGAVVGVVILVTGVIVAFVLAEVLRRMR
jgi:hypothetical protein